MSSQFLLKANVNVVAVSRTETPELISLADKFSGALIISKGDVALDKDNKVKCISQEYC